MTCFSERDGIYTMCGNTRNATTRMAIKKSEFPLKHAKYYGLEIGINEPPRGKTNNVVSDQV